MRWHCKGKECRLQESVGKAAEGGELYQSHGLDSRRPKWTREGEQEQQEMKTEEEEEEDEKEGNRNPA